MPFDASTRWHGISSGKWFLPQAPPTGRYSKGTLRVAGCSGLLTTSLGMLVAFVPSRQIESVLLFELKMTVGVLAPTLVGVLLYRRASRQRT